MLFFRLYRLSCNYKFLYPRWKYLCCTSELIESTKTISISNVLTLPEGEPFFPTAKILVKALIRFWTQPLWLLITEFSLSHFAWKKTSPRSLYNQSNARSNFVQVAFFLVAATQAKFRRHTSHVRAESTANEGEQRILLICIRFCSCEVRRLNLALQTFYRLNWCLFFPSSSVSMIYNSRANDQLHDAARKGIRSETHRKLLAISREGGCEIIQFSRKVESKFFFFLLFFGLDWLIPPSHSSTCNWNIVMAKLQSIKIDLIQYGKVTVEISYTVESR